jgi:Leucine-rich repeat (LRR) protein
MFSRPLEIQNWWQQLTPTWQRIFLQNLQWNSKTPSEASLASLRELDCQGFRISDLRPLQYFTHLEVLHIGQTEVVHAAPLGLLTQLRELHAPYLSVRDWRVLGNLSYLEVLDLSYPRFYKKIKLPDFRRLPNLRELYLNDCGLKDHSSFECLSRLELLSVSFNPMVRERLNGWRARRPYCRVLF